VTVAVAADFPTAWRPQGVGLIEEASNLDHQALDQVAGAMTAAAVAIAETGTVVLDFRPGQGRRALTLLPTITCASSWRSQVADGVPERWRG